ncbi:MAG: cellulase family glycosylhydrolase [Armatimonadetes bacterium]|nr:cellulase family glycosylhydrolase [Armatimonadota bacterium]
MTRPSRRLCGFNLLEMFIYNGQPSPGFRQEEIARIHEWGFNFARLPLDYRFLTHDTAGDDFNPGALRQIDKVLDDGEEFGIHVSINLHHAPGFCINTPRETWTLWTSKGAQMENERIWGMFARRYDGRNHVSFDLVNEPTGCTMEQYTAFVREMVEAIRCVDDDRFIIADGYDVGRKVIEGVEDLGIGQSLHCYEPVWVTHHLAGWVPAMTAYTEPPVYPGPLPKREDYAETFPPGHPHRWVVEKYGQGMMDREWLRRELQPWFDYAVAGNWVHCGEFGVHPTAPHETSLNWHEDMLSLLHEHGIGWALWNLRGSFGILDSGRPEGEMISLPNGDLLDEKLLQFLQRYRQ